MGLLQQLIRSFIVHMFWWKFKIQRFIWDWELIQIYTCGRHLRIYVPSNWIYLDEAYQIDRRPWKKWPCRIFRLIGQWFELTCGTEKALFSLGRPIIWRIILVPFPKSIFTKRSYLTPQKGTVFFWLLFFLFFWFFFFFSSCFSSSAWVTDFHLLH